jgi:hypothetical protein
MLVADGEQRLLERASLDLREERRNFLKGGQGRVRRFRDRDAL